MVKKIAEKTKKRKKALSPELRVSMFVEAYLLNFNATKAYSTVFERPMDPACSAAASEFLHNHSTQQYLQRRLKERRAELHVDQMYVVRKLTEIVETDYTQASQVMSEKQLSALPEEVRKLIQSVKLKKSTNSYTNSNGSDSETINEEYEVTFMSKDKALDGLAKHTGTFAKDNVNYNVDGGKMSFTDMIKALAGIKP